VELNWPVAWWLEIIQLTRWGLIPEVGHPQKNTNVTGATVFAMQHVSGRKSVSHLNRKIFAGYISCCLEMWLEGVKLCAQCRHPALTTGAFEGV